MTRDDAIKLAGDTGAIRPGEFIDMCVSLGMLKLDEPKSAVEKFKEAIFRLETKDRHVCGLLHAIECAGLKITEK